MLLRGTHGFTLLQLLIALLVAGLAGAGSVSAARSLVRVSAVSTAARAVRAQLAYARAVAIARREKISIEIEPAGDLAIADSRDSVIRRLPLLGARDSHLDSVRLRPTVLRFNSRGQAAPGSVYLHGPGGGIRLVVNFLGRVREEKLP